MGKPRVTWLLPVCNSEQHLESTLISIAEQDDANQTVYAWDHGSTDATPALLRKWIGRELPGRIVGRERIGRGRAMAQLVVNAQSELLACTHAGWANEPDRLRRQIDYLYDHRKVGVLGTQRYLTADNQQVSDDPTNDAELRWALRFKRPMHPHTVMLRRSAVLEAGNFRDLAGDLADYDLWVRMNVIVRFGLIDMPLVRCKLGDSDKQTPPAADTDALIQIRDTLIDRLLPGTDPSAARRLLNLAHNADDPHVTADDLLRFRHAAMLAARACRYEPTFYTATTLFKQQHDRLRARKLQGTPLIRPVLPLLKRASKLLHRDNKDHNDTAAA